MFAMRSLADKSRAWKEKRQPISSATITEFDLSLALDQLA